jgi:dolichol-phosphate mannosyltransferase
MLVATAKPSLGVLEQRPILPGKGDSSRIRTQPHFMQAATGQEGGSRLIESPPHRTLVAIATYNESENLGSLVNEIHTHLPDGDVLVIDDNSPDGTGRLADEIAATDPRTRVLHRRGKLGLGTAILAAMRYAQEHDFDYLITMDADFSHHPRYLPGLLAGMKRHDVMIGSRYVPGGGASNWPFSRRAISLAVNALVRLLMRIPAQDTSGGYRCYRVSRLKYTNFDKLLSRGYSFEEELLYACHKARLRIGETPIIFENRSAGKSKLALREMLRSGLILLRLGLRELFDYREP